MHGGFFPRASVLSGALLPSWFWILASSTILQRINSCCFKSPSSHYFVIGATGKYTVSSPMGLSILRVLEALWQTPLPSPLLTLCHWPPDLRWSDQADEPSHIQLGNSFSPWRLPPDLWPSNCTPGCITNRNTPRRSPNVQNSPCWYYPQSPQTGTCPRLVSSRMDRLYCVLLKWVCAAMSESEPRLSPKA